jgi:hypothetical protein
MFNCDKIIQKAKSKYNDALRGKRYQDSLLDGDTSLIDIEDIVKRKKVYVQDIALLEDVFGVDTFIDIDSIKEGKQK